MAAEDRRDHGPGLCRARRDGAAAGADSVSGRRQGQPGGCRAVCLYPRGARRGLSLRRLSGGARLAGSLRRAAGICRHALHRRGVKSEVSAITSLEKGDMKKAAGRSHTFTWQDPFSAAAAGLGLSGLDYLRKMARGELPMPPISVLMNVTGTEVEEGLVTFTA